MIIPAALRVAAHPVEKTDAVTRARAVQRGADGDLAKRDPSSPPAALPSRRGPSSDQDAAVVQFGKEALGLARPTTEPPGAKREATESASPGSERPLAPAGAETPEAAQAAAGEEQDEGGAEPGEEKSNAPPGSQDLSEEEALQVDEMRSRDREVRAHEQAHKSAGGAHTGSIRLQYEVGPDGKRYAVAGSVPIDVSPVKGDPEATLRKMDVVRRAALAPASPSGADRHVAAQASRLAVRARAELAAKRYANGQQLMREAQGTEKPDEGGAEGPGLAVRPPKREPDDRQPQSVSPGRSFGPSFLRQPAASIYARARSKPDSRGLGLFA